MVTEMDDDEEMLSAEEKHSNYKMLLKALRDTEDISNITKHWMKEHMEFIVRIRGCFEDFQRLAQAVTEAEKEDARQAEVLMKNLEHSINAHDTFDITVYRLMCIKLEYFVRKFVPEEDLADIFASMGI
jgi:DNA-binding SARP family transcriptional activator